MRIFFSPSRELAAHRLSHPGSRIYDPRERWLLGVLDGLLRLGTIPLRARPAAVDRDARIDTGAVRKVTALRLDRIGDLITTLPALRELKRSFPNAELELAVGSWNRPIGEGLDFVDSVRVVDVPWAAWERRASYREALDSLRAAGSDLMIDFQGDVRVLTLMALAGPRFRAGYGDTGGEYLLTHRGRWDESISWYRQNMNLVDSLTGIDESPRQDIEPVNFLRDTDRRALRERLRSHGPRGMTVPPRARPLIGIHPSAGRGIKEWRPERFVELIRSLGLDGDILLTGAESDRPSVEAITASLGVDERPGVWLDSGSLRTFAALIEILDVFVTGDTGPMHIAQAVGTRNVAIFGPSDPVRYGPESPSGRIVVQEPVFCSPCNMIRRPPRECVAEPMPECMAGIRVDAVLDAIRRQLASENA